MLSIEEQEKIIEAIEIPWLTQKDVAHRFRITEQLVRDLVREAKTSPAKLRYAKEYEAQQRSME